MKLASLCTLLLFSICLPLNSTTTKDFCKKLKKTELHLHLGGSWPYSFIERVAQKDVLQELNQKITALHQSFDYHTAFYIFDTITKIVNTDALVEQGVIELCQELARDNVDHVEIRTGLKDLGGGKAGYLEAILRGIKKSNAPLTATIVLSVRRDAKKEEVQETINYILKYREQGVIGLDISGDSTKGTTQGIFDVIHLAHENNIPITLHLGESSKETADQQRRELELLKPQRIGHGVHLCGNAQQWILDKKLPVELCLTSARTVGMIKDFKDHPALQLLLAGHPVVICTDDPLIFRVTLSDEVENVATTLNLSCDDLQRLQDTAQKQIFTNNKI